MTVQKRQHLTYPSLSRLRERLADAKAAHLQVFDLAKYDHDLGVWEWNAKVTPTHDLEPYEITIYHTMTDNRVHTHCTCTAGSYGVPCRHLAIVLDTLSLTTSMMKVRVMDSPEFTRFMELALLPEWKGDNEQQATD